MRRKRGDGITRRSQEHKKQLAMDKDLQRAIDIVNSPPEPIKPITTVICKRKPFQRVDVAKISSAAAIVGAQPVTEVAYCKTCGSPVISSVEGWQKHYNRMPICEAAK